MLISITALTYDPDGSRMLRLTPKAALALNTGGRRVSRTATLDGGAVVYDTGYAAADRTLRLTVQARDATVPAFLERMVRLHSLVRVASGHGVHVGVPEKWAHNDDNTATLTVLVTTEEA